MFFRLIATTLLAALAAPAWASRDCADAGDELRATLAAMHGTPLTVALYLKVAAHPDAFDFALALNNDGSTATFPSAALTFTTTEDQYQARARDSSTGSTSAIHTATAGTFDGVWMGWVGVYTSSTDRDIYIDSVSNTGNDTTNVDMGSALQQLTLCIAPVDPPSAGTDGKIAEVAIWSSALSTADITDYLDNRMAANCLTVTPDAYYSLSTSSLADESGNGNTTLTNTGTTFDGADHPAITGCDTGGGYSLLQKINQRQGVQQ